MVKSRVMRTPLLVRLSRCRADRVGRVRRRPSSVPVVYKKLPNGLRVVISENHAAPVVVVEVMYRIGFRIEPQERTGFAHLFEHLMFQGSEHVGKFEHVRIVNENGGTLNGSTRFDHTNYFEVMPSNALELAMWLEADRMRSLKITPENAEEPAGRGQRRSPRQRAQPAVWRVRVARPAAEGEHQLVQRAQLLRRPVGSPGGERSKT